MQTTDNERENLEAHVDLCALRYQGLESRIESLELHLSEITSMLRDLKTDIEDLRQVQNSRWSQAQVAVIGLLAGTTAFFIVQWMQTL